MTDTIQGHRHHATPRNAGRISIIQLVLLCGMATLCTLAGVGYWLWSTEPEHWTEHQAFLQTHSEAEINDLAAKAEQRFAELSNFFESDALIQKAGNRTGINKAAGRAGLPSAAQADPNRPITRTLAFSTDEINAWLSRRAPQWLANRGTPMPSGVSQPMVAVDNRQMVAAFQYKSKEVEQVVSMYFNLAINSDGKAQLKLDRVQGGNLPLPVEQLSHRLASGNDASESVKKIAAMFQGQQFDPVWDIDQSREARLLGFKPTSTGLEVTVRTQPKKKKG